MKLSTLPALPSRKTRVLTALTSFAALVAWSFAGIELIIGYNRWTFIGDGLIFIHYGIVFAAIASFWSAGGLLMGLRRWGGGGLAISGAILAVAHGLSRLTQSPPFGTFGVTATEIPAAVWTTTLLGALILGCLVADIAVDIIRNRPPSEDE